MKRTTALLLLPLVLTGCRLFDQHKRAAADAVASAVVRSLIHIHGSAPDVRRAPRPATLLTSSTVAVEIKVVTSGPANRCPMRRI